MLLFIIVSLTEPLSIVLFAPISTSSSNITLPVCGALKFFSGDGIKPKPLIPILEPSWIQTLLCINVFLIVTNDPIRHFSPITTLLSITLLLPIKVLFPICTFFPIRTFFPKFTFGYIFLI